MAKAPHLSPAHADNDALILEGVRQGVLQDGARFGVTHPRRQLLDVLLQTMLLAMHGGWEQELLDQCGLLLASHPQTGRPSQPRNDDGHYYLSDSDDQFPR